MAIVVGASLVLVFLHIALHLVIRFRRFVPEQLRESLSVTNDVGLHSWLTIAVTIILASACFVLAVQGPRLAWSLAGLLFLGLSADDFTKFHEHVGEIAWPALKTTVYAWLLVMGPLLAAGGVFVYVQLCRILPERRDRRIVFYGFACLGAALGLEAIEGPLGTSGLTWRGLSLARYGQPLEEFLELLGPTLLLYCTLGLLERRGLFHGAGSLRPDEAPAGSGPPDAGDPGR